MIGKGIKRLKEALAAVLAIIKKRKWIISGVVILVIVAAALVAARLRPLEIVLIEMKPRTISLIFQEEGTIAPVTERKIHTVFGGEIAAVAVEEGEDVTSGTLLLEFDTEKIDLSLVQLSAQLRSIEGQEQQAFSRPDPSRVAHQQLLIEQAETQLETAKSELEDMLILYQAGAVSTADYEAAERAVQHAENLLAQQKKALEMIWDAAAPPAGTREHFAGLRESLDAQIALLEHQKDEARIYAPIGGRIKRLHVDEGTVVPPGSPIIEIFQPGSYEVEVYLHAEDVIHLNIGLKVTAVIDHAVEDILLEGIVTEIAPAAIEKISPLGLIEQRVRVNVHLEEDHGMIRPGYSVDVEFIAHQETDRLVVPEAAIFPYEGEDALWVVRDGEAAVQVVEKGFETDDEVVITSGLEEGDLVVRNPQAEGLAPGKRIEQ